MLNIFKLTQDEFGYLADKPGSSKYYGINNTGPCNKGFRIKLSPEVMRSLGVETNSGFTTYTKKDSMSVSQEELAYILSCFVEDPKSKSVCKFNLSDGSLVKMEVVSESYATIMKTL